MVGEIIDYGNAILDASGSFKKVKGEGVTEENWQKMVDYAAEKGWKSGNFKKLNLPFETKLLAQPREVRQRMSKRVEDFVYNILVNVFNASDTAEIAKDIILQAGSHNIGNKAERIEDPAEWTEEKIISKAKLLDVNTGPQGDFDD